MNTETVTTRANESLGHTRPSSAVRVTFESDSSRVPSGTLSPSSVFTVPGVQLLWDRSNTTCAATHNRSPTVDKVVTRTMKPTILAVLGTLTARTMAINGSRVRLVRIYGMTVSTRVRASRQNIIRCMTAV